MKLNLASIADKEDWKGFDLPVFDIAAVREKTYREPVWIHFGAGNIFRTFPAVLLQKLLDEGVCDRGVIVAEGFDYVIIDQAYVPYDNLSLLLVLKSDGSMEKKVTASVTESLKASRTLTGTGKDWKRFSGRLPCRWSVLPIRKKATAQLLPTWKKA